MVERGGHSVEKLFGEDCSVSATGGVHCRHAAVQILLETAAQQANIIHIARVW